MAPGTDEIPLEKDPRLEGGEWLFRKGGQVFGPVDSRGIAAMLYRGEIDGATPVSSGDGAWRSVSEISLFLVHAKKAAAARRVEREVTGARLLRKRRHRRRVVVAVLGVLVLVAGGVTGAVLLTRGVAATSPLLEDFGAGIRIASAARVGVSRRAVEEELVDVPLDSPDRGAAKRRAARPRPAPSQGAVEGGELVATQFDARKIQGVVGREQRTLAPCFRAEASRSPEFRGDVPIEFAIGNDGRVVQLWIDEPRFRKGPLQECLTAALAAWRFDPFPGQRPTVSLAFRIGP
ncbi:MAG TPA: AgmX/PglI C-terminal domain-containing protein [Anaeromyxobacter sp.]